jgi:hypothetical protein
MRINWRGAVACGAVLILAGCANTVSAGTPTAIPQPTSSPTSTGIAEPVDVTEAFREFAHTSCDKANAEGVVEIGWDGTQKLILVPKSMAYEDFTAVFIDDSGIPALVWETDSFAACNASNGFTLAEESGGVYETGITFNSDTGTFESSIDQGGGEGGGEGEQKLLFTYTVVDGVFVSQGIEADWGTTTIEITYGMPSDADIAILHSAVDAFLAENG